MGTGKNKGALFALYKKTKTTPIDKKFSVIVGCEAILNFATLTTVRFEAEEGTDWERGKRHNEKGRKQKAEAGGEDFFADCFWFANI